MLLSLAPRPNTDSLTLTLATPTVLPLVVKLDGPLADGASANPSAAALDQTVETLARNSALDSVRIAAEVICGQAKHCDVPRGKASDIANQFQEISSTFAAISVNATTEEVVSYAEQILETSERVKHYIQEVETQKSWLFGRRRQSDIHAALLGEYACLLSFLKGGPTPSPDSPSSSGSRRLRHHARQSAALDIASAGLSAIATVSENFLPPLSVAAQAAQHVVDLVQTRFSNYDDCVNLIEKIHVMLKTFRTDFLRHAKHSADLVKCCMDLTAVIINVSSRLETLLARNRVLQVLLAKDVAKVISTAARDIDDALRNYQIMVSTWMAGKVHGLTETLDALARTHDQQTIPPRLTSKLLPPKSRAFHGRLSEVKRAVTILCQPGPPYSHLPILGPAGIGKTALALSIAHDDEIEDRFSDRRFFFSCEAAFNAAAAVTNICRTLGLDISRQDPLFTLCNFLRSSESPTLLILDNFETVWFGQNRADAEMLLSQLNEVPNLHLIVTIRGSVFPTRITWSVLQQEAVLQPLSGDSARTTFIDLAQCSIDSSEEPFLAELLAAVDYIPLAVVLLAYLAASGETPSDLLRQWKTQRTALLAYDQAEGREFNVDVSIKLSLSHIPADAIEALPLLSICSRLPDGLFPQAMQQLAPAFQTPIELSCRVLTRLALVYRGQYGELRMHNLIRMYVQDHYPISPEHHDQLCAVYFGLARLSNVTLDEGFPALAARITPEAGNLAAVLAGEIDNIHGAPNAQLVQAVIDFSYFSFHTVPMPELAQTLLPHLTDPSQRLDCLWILCRLLQYVGRMDDATAAAQSMRLVASEIGSTLYEARAIQMLGHLERLISDNYDEAIRLTNIARDQFTAIGDLKGIAQCTQTLGIVQFLLCNYEASTRLFKDAREAFIALGDLQGAASCMQYLGDTQFMICNPEEAKRLLNIARDEYVAIGDRTGQAICAHFLGDVYHLLSEYDEATRLLTLARDEFSALGNRRGRAQCLRTLGEIQRMLCRYEDATRILTATREEFSSMKDRLGVTQCTQYLAEIKNACGDYDEAIRDLEWARHEYTAIGDPLGIAQCTQCLGEIQLNLENYAEATRLMNQAKNEYADAENPTGAAQCVQSLGTIESELKNYAEAIRLLTEACDQYVAVGYRGGVVQCKQVLADVQIDLGNCDDALFLLTEANEEAAVLGDGLVLARCTLSFGRARYALKNYEEATRFVTEAREQFVAVHDLPGQKACTNLLAELQTAAVQSDPSKCFNLAV